MKNLIFNIFIFICIIAGCVNKCTKGNDKKEHIMYGYEKMFNQRQFDSLCVADTLNPILDSWISTPFVDYETKEQVIKYVYLKNDGEIVYTIIPQDTLFLFNKRYVTESE